MTASQEPDDPDIQIVEQEDGEITLYIDGGQAMQGWERELMWESADMLCSFGSEFLEVGLGLGLSAIHIASHPNTERHRVVEKYQRVIDMFHERHPSPPPPMEIVCADFFDFVHTLEPLTLDGIFFDPYFGRASGWDEPALWGEVVPVLRRALRVGGALVPYFSTQPILKWPFVDYFDRIIVQRRPYLTYPTTEYTRGTSGYAFIQCFIRTQ